MVFLSLNRVTIVEIKKKLCGLFLISVYVSIYRPFPLVYSYPTSRLSFPFPASPSILVITSNHICLHLCLHYFVHSSLSISPVHNFLPQLSSALMFDAVHVVVGAVRELNRSQEIGVKPLSCTSPQIWQHGTSLMNYLRMVNAL